MKKIVAAALILGLVLFLIPMGFRHENVQEDPDAPAVLPESGKAVTILIDGELQEMDLNEYLWGVVAAEMPASFELEALKAQAVAARTYSLNKAGQAANHPEADLCTDHTCCQAWIAREKAQANWGDNAQTYTDKITQAVAETNGEVALYEGALISALYHSSSTDTTQDAVAVWGGNVPYLKSVPSPEGEEVPDYHSTVTYPSQECKDRILSAKPEAVLEGDPANWFTNAVYSDGGSVLTIDLGGVTVSGHEARTIFDLRSASFTVECTPDSVTFSVTGYGHGVGMSQYGANAMAAEGKTYQEILQHYYTGITVESYE